MDNEPSKNVLRDAEEPGGHSETETGEDAWATKAGAQRRGRDEEPALRAAARGTGAVSIIMGGGE